MKRSLQYGLLMLGLVGVASVHAQSGSAAAGGRTFLSTCAGCHGADGRGGERGPNIATARDVVSLGDAELGSFVRNGVTGAGMPAFSFLGDVGIADVVAYLRVLQGVLQGKPGEAKVSGDAEAGRALFFGKAECGRCHMMHGEGGFIGADLSDYGSAVAPDKIRVAIVDADGRDAGGTMGVTAELIELRAADGAKLRGVLRAEDNFTLVLQMEDGRYRRFTKAAVSDIHRMGRSLMPRDYKDRLSAKELDDIVSYMVRSARGIDTGPAIKTNGGAK